MKISLRTTGQQRWAAGENFSIETETGSKGQAGAEVPVLRFVWPDLSDRCVGSGLERVRRNQGAPGVDGLKIQQIIESDQGVAGFPDGLEELLRTKIYQPWSEPLK